MQSMLSKQQGNVHHHLLAFQPRAAAPMMTANAVSSFSLKQYLITLITVDSRLLGLQLYKPTESQSYLSSTGPIPANTLRLVGEKVNYICTKQGPLATYSDLF